MFALSVSQIWAWLLAHNLKDIENRTYPPLPEAIGQPLLIHAPLQPDASIWSDERLTPVWQQKGILIPDLPETYRLGGIIGVATLVGVVRQSASPWFNGPYGWVLRDARPLPFLSWRGERGLFQIRHPRLERLVQARQEHAPAQSARVIMTLGYRSAGAMPLLEHLVAQRCPVLDCRLWPWSKIDYFQQFDQERLLRRLGPLYLPMRTLGNRNFKRPDLPHELADPEIGLAQALQWLESMGKICLVCGCPDAASCHRNRIALLLRQRSQQTARNVSCHIAHLLAQPASASNVPVRSTTPRQPRSQKLPAKPAPQTVQPHMVQRSLFEEQW